MSESKRGVLVTTEHRGVFFGYLVGEPSKEKVLLEKARNCIYWDASTHGFVGLAERGPGRECKVGPAAPTLTLFGITSVAECTAEATEAWERAPWR
jgi:hypothetical protein